MLNDLIAKFLENSNPGFIYIPITGVYIIFTNVRPFMLNDLIAKFLENSNPGFIYIPITGVYILFTNVIYDVSCKYIKEIRSKITALSDTNPLYHLFSHFLIAPVYTELYFIIHSLY